MNDPETSYPEPLHFRAEKRLLNRSLRSALLNLLIYLAAAAYFYFQDLGHWSLYAFVLLALLAHGWELWPYLKSPKLENQGFRLSEQGLALDTPQGSHYLPLSAIHQLQSSRQRLRVMPEREIRFRTSQGDFRRALPEETLALRGRQLSKRLAEWQTALKHAKTIH